MDLYLALDVLHLRYPTYVATTTPAERLLYRLYIMLKGAKEQHAHEHMALEMEAERLAAEATGSPAGRF